MNNADGARHGRDVYKVVELVGSSTESIEEAIRTAILRAGKTLRHLRWFEVVQMRGHVEDGEIHHWPRTTFDVL